MSERKWKVQVELPAVQAISDDCAWVTIRDMEFDNRPSAVEAYRRMEKEYEWPLRIVQSVKLSEEHDTTLERYEPPSEFGICLGCGCEIEKGVSWCGQCSQPQMEDDCE